MVWPSAERTKFADGNTDGDMEEKCVDRGPTIVEREKYTVDAGRSNCETGAHYEPEITGPALPLLFPVSRSIESESP